MIHAARHVYRTVPADGAQIVVLFTDFEFDDLYGQGPGSGTRNEPILGIGPGPGRGRTARRGGMGFGHPAGHDVARVPRRAGLLERNR